MAQISIRILRDAYPGKNDKEVVDFHAKSHGYHVMLKLQPGNINDYDIGMCHTADEFKAYMAEYRGAEILYDDRAASLRITEEMVLKAKCQECSKAATRQSLRLYAGNDFYVCPKCAAMYCNQCLRYLPLTGSPGYAKCPSCDVKLKRAIPGTIA